MDSKESPEQPVHIDTGGGAYVGGSVDTGGGDFVGRDQYKFITVIQQFIRNPAEWQDAIWRGLIRHWRILVLILVLEIGLGALFVRYKDLYLIPVGLWLLAEGLLLAGALGWYVWARSRKNSRHLFVTLPTSAALLLLVGWQSWRVVSPPAFDSQTYGIAVAELGEGAGNHRSERAREISRQVYEHLLNYFGKSATDLQSPDSEGQIKLVHVGVIPDSATAQSYGKQIRADIVLWGQILTTKENSATIRFEILETPDRAVNPEFPLVLPVGLKYTDVIVNELDLESDPLLLKEVTRQQTTIITRFALGLRDFLRRNYISAAKNLEAAVQAIGASSRLSASPEGLSLLYFYVGRAYHGMERVEQGQEWLIKAQENNSREPAYPLALALGYASLGKMDARDEQLTRAMTLLSSWLQTHPADATAYFDRGVIYQIYDRHEYAILDFEAALQQDPDYYIAYISLGQSAAKLGDIDQSVEMLQKGIELAAEKGINPSWARLNLALIYEDTGEIENARQEFQALTSPQTEERWFHYYYAGFLERQNEMDAALIAYQKSIQLSSNSGIGKGWAYGNLAGFLERRKLYRQAAENYMKALHEAPDDALLHAKLGNVYSILGDIPKARLEYDQALKLGSDIYYVYATYAGMLFQLGDYETAAQMYQESLELRPVDGAVLLNLAQTYIRMGEQDKAVETLMKILGVEELKENHQTACDQLKMLDVDSTHEECSDGLTN